MRELKYRFVTTDYKQKNVPLEKKKKCASGSEENSEIGAPPALSPFAGRLLK